MHSPTPFSFGMSAHTPSPPPPEETTPELVPFPLPKLDDSNIEDHTKNKFIYMHDSGDIERFFDDVYPNPDGSLTGIPPLRESLRLFPLEEKKFTTHTPLTDPTTGESIKSSLTGEELRVVPGLPQFLSKDMSEQEFDLYRMRKAQLKRDILPRVYDYDLVLKPGLVQQPDIRVMETAVNAKLVNKQYSFRDRASGGLCQGFQVTAGTFRQYVQQPGADATKITPDKMLKPGQLFFQTRMKIDWKTMSMRDPETGFLWPCFNPKDVPEKVRKEMKHQGFEFETLGQFFGNYPFLAAYDETKHPLWARRCEAERIEFEADNAVTYAGTLANQVTLRSQALTRLQAEALANGVYDMPKRSFQPGARYMGNYEDLARQSSHPATQQPTLDSRSNARSTYHSMRDVGSLAPSQHASMQYGYNNQQHNIGPGSFYYAPWAQNTAPPQAAPRNPFVNNQYTSGSTADVPQYGQSAYGMPVPPQGPPPRMLPPPIPGAQFPPPQFIQPHGQGQFSNPQMPVQQAPPPITWADFTRAFRREYDIPYVEMEVALRDPGMGRMHSLALDFSVGAIYCGFGIHCTRHLGFCPGCLKKKKVPGEKPTGL
ncbi:hypothetical protein EJ08DRAFT_662080 [Tothia fuscella]|uniref:Uncharacterized protein n=1 Tax=Tothia fuscella TaxID=1048955 RepID=A0A9P4TX28_9PEZI|nr:hypothetical protein EJ08DRAFT_662080 [Tothia fuscella]